ncbi:MAG: DUF1559 domain-containing protein [Planctomycetaceae bacterium]|nr:DUF1559 domain-containing protein [Planctomycetaceae bacterium]MCB9950639.1 DUF1559 domain-containing protein [Planctomycetaceae bacterium]
MKAFRSPASRPQRRGFTLIELLVVITIIGILASLILPGVQQVRARARQAECLNNMRQVGLALINFSSSHNGAFPQMVGTDNGEMVVVPASGGSPATTAPAPWTVAVLPLLEQSGLHDRLLTSSRSETFAQLAVNDIPAFNCPSDLNTDFPGTLSYVVNGGYMTLSRWSGSANPANGHGITGYDWQLDGTGAVTFEDQQVTKGTGVIFRGGTTTVDSIRDGTSQTLLLSENNDILPFDTTTGLGGWISSAPGNLCFAMPIAETSGAAFPASTGDSASNGVGRIVTAGSLTANKPVAMELGTSGTPFSLSTPNFEYGKINARLGGAPEGASPRPSSQHGQVVNVIMADGSGKSLAQNIDESVYARLISSNGNKGNQAILSGY